MLRRGAPCWRLDLGAINMPFESVLHALRTTGVNCVDMMPSNDPYWPRSAIVGKRKLDDMEESLLKEMEDVFFPQINEAARDHGKLACNPHHVKIIDLGLAKLFTKSNRMNRAVATTLVGTCLCQSVFEFSSQSSERHGPILFEFKKIYDEHRYDRLHCT